MLEVRKQKLRAETTALLLELKPKDSLLDVGCGDGFVISYFAKAKQVVGVDIEISQLKTAKSRVRGSNIDFIWAHGAMLPFRSNSFTKVCVLEVLEHLPSQDQLSLVGEVDRILKSDGIVVVSFPWKEKIEYTRCIHCGKLTPIAGHLHSMDVEKMDALLPRYYFGFARRHLPNIPLISISRFCEFVPLKVWLILNDLLGIIRKGYWVLLGYQKKMVIER